MGHPGHSENVYSSARPIYPFSGQTFENNPLEKGYVTLVLFGLFIYLIIYDFKEYYTPELYSDSLYYLILLKVIYIIRQISS